MLGPCVGTKTTHSQVMLGPCIGTKTTHSQVMLGPCIGTNTTHGLVTLYHLSNTFTPNKHHYDDTIPTTQFRRHNSDDKIPTTLPSTQFRRHYSDDTIPTALFPRYNSDDTIPTTQFRRHNSNDTIQTKHNSAKSSHCRDHTLCSPPYNTNIPIPFEQLNQIHVLSDIANRTIPGNLITVFWARENS